ncbi:hypothetical protein [Sphingomonas baiyangensis]|nr:hypothetical protein [Sphingomonas baiyangensis]
MARLRFRQRGEAMRDGTVHVDPRDGGGRVPMPREEWDRCVDWFACEIRPATRALKLLILLQIPLAILTLGILTRLDLIAPIDRMFAGAFAIVPVLVVTCWPLLLGAAIYWRAYRTIVRHFADGLAQRPRVPAADRTTRRLHLAEIVALVLVGPHLLIALYGTLAPNAFDHTPWMGTRLGPLDLIGFALLGWIGWRHLRRRRFA